MNKYLFFNPVKNLNFYKDFWLRLKDNNIEAKIIAFDKKILANFDLQVENWLKFFDVNGKFFILNKIAWFYYLIKFYKLKKQKFNKIVFLSEKDIYKTLLPAMIFNNIYLFKPPFKKLANNIFARIARKVLEKKLTIIILEDNLIDLPAGLKTEVLNPGVKTKGFEHQESIFFDLAKHNTPLKNTSFFTLGSILDKGDDHNLEVLFHAASELYGHIKNLQIIIVGDTQKRKQLVWQCKKLKIDSFVWFVGWQKYLGKWLNNFSIYLNLYEKNNLNDLTNTLQAMAYATPVIANENSGLDKIIINNKTGYRLNRLDSKELIQTIIKIQKNKKLLAEMGKNAKTLIDNNYSIDKMVEQFLEITTK